MVSVLAQPSNPQGKVTTVTIAAFLGSKDQLLLHNHGSFMFWPSNARRVSDVPLCRSVTVHNFSLLRIFNVLDSM